MRDDTEEALVAAGMVVIVVFLIGLAFWGGREDVSNSDNYLRGMECLRASEKP